jgi:hypothetical protein
MGSTRHRHSTGRKAGASRSTTNTRPTSTRKTAKPSRPDLHAVLGRLSDSLSIIATATSALTHAQEGSGTVAAQDVGEEITTLEHGVRALRGAYDEMDVAIRAVTP